MSEDNQTRVEPGIYQHYRRGDFYLLLGVVTDSNSQVDYVRYIPLKYPIREVVRPLSEFFGQVAEGDYRGQRYRYVPPTEWEKILTKLR